MNLRKLRSRLNILYRKVFVDYMELTLKRELKGCKSFLELGCGRNSPATRLIHNLRSVGIDLHLPSLRNNKNEGHFEDYILADVRFLPFRDISFDCVAAFDVIEHLPESQGQRLIRTMEKISRKKIIIFTPNGYNPKYHLEDDNPLQAHMSGWTVNEFSSRGYVVFGINGIRALRGEGARPTIKPLLLGHLISKLTDRFVYYSPYRAFQLLCIKNKH